MGKSMSAATGTKGLRGKVGPVAIVLATKAASLVAMIVAVYLLVMFLAIRVVPMTMGFVLSGTGVTDATPWKTVLMVWIAPSLVLIALIITGAIFLVRWLWKQRARLVEKVSVWAFGRETKKVTPISEARATGSTKSRNRQTKTA